MSISYTEHLARNRRLAILRLLESAPGYRANDSVLQTALERYGHQATRDVLRAELAWLAEQLLVRLEVVPGSSPGQAEVHVATLTERGGDVAGGRAFDPGVKRPAPR